MVYADRYFVWKDPACGGKDPEWEEMSKDAFIRFLNDPDPEKRRENRARKFILLEDDWECSHMTGMEVTPEVYRQWDRDRKRELYRERRMREKIVFSLDDPVTDGEEEMTFHEVVSPREDATEEGKKLIWLRQALRTLTDKEREAVDLVFLKNPDGWSVREVAADVGIPASTLRERVGSALKKLREDYESRQ